MDKIIVCLNKDGHFVPAYDSDDFLKNKYYKPGEYYTIPIQKAPRNWLFHKKFMALVKLCWLNLPEQYDSLFPNFEALRKAIEIEAGHYDIQYNFDGSEAKIAKSISFESMDEPSFEELYQKCLSVIQQKILTGNTKEEIEKEIINFY